MITQQMKVAARCSLANGVRLNELSLVVNNVSTYCLGALGGGSNQTDAHLFGGATSLGVRLVSEPT